MLVTKCSHLLKPKGLFPCRCSGGKAWISSWNKVWSISRFIIVNRTFSISLIKHIPRKLFSLKKDKKSRTEWHLLFSSHFVLCFIWTGPKSHFLATKGEAPRRNNLFSLVSESLPLPKSSLDTIVSLAQHLDWWLLYFCTECFLSGDTREENSFAPWKQVSIRHNTSNTIIYWQKLPKQSYTRYPH